MAKTRIALSFLMVMVMVWAVQILTAGSVGAQDATMILEDTKTFKSLQRPPVTFSHEKHAAMYKDCVQCHHDYEYKASKKGNVWGGDGQTCSQCHKLEPVDGKSGLRTAFHENCTGCHRALTKEGKDKTGPVTCGECHARGK